MGKRTIVFGVIVALSFFSLRADAATVLGSSQNWSGYAATGGQFTSVGASWTIPQSSAPTSSSLSADATWVGIGGVTNHDLIQAGTQTIFQGGTATYEAWYELLPADSVQVPLNVHPGDAMTISIAQQSAGAWLISFTDTTTGQNYATSTTYASSLSSAEWIEEAPSDARGQVTLDNFGTAAFTNDFATLNGYQVTITGSNALPMTMINRTGQAIATPSALGGDGASFTISRTSVPATGTPTSIFISRPGGGRWSRSGVGVQGFVPMPRAFRLFRGNSRLRFMKERF